MIVSRCRDIEEYKRVHAQRDNRCISNAENLFDSGYYFFCFYSRETGKILGCIYLEDDNGRVCLSGFSVRKIYDIFIRAIKLISDIFHKDDLYSLTDKKSAIMVLLRCGFKKIDDETYLRKAF